MVTEKVENTHFSQKNQKLKLTLIVIILCFLLHSEHTVLLFDLFIENQCILNAQINQQYQ